MANRELWMTVSDYPNYEVSNYGHVRNRKTSALLKPGIKSNGYSVVTLCNDAGRKTKHVHKIVTNAFYGEDNKLVVNHIDGNKRNNRLENLELVTQGRNNKHAYEIGLKEPKQPPIVRRKVQIVETGEIFDSLHDCACSIDGNHRHISDCLNGKLKSHKGYHFKEVNL